MTLRIPSLITSAALVATTYLTMSCSPDASPSCTVGGETGVTCDSLVHCSSGDFVQGCCIGGTCNATADAGQPPDKTQTAGTFLGHAWYVTQSRILVWDGVPYIPYAAPDLSFYDDPTVGDYHFWIDSDNTPTADPNYVDQLTTDITNAGSTYTVLFLTKEPSNADASMLFDPQERTAIVDSWLPYASAIRKDGLRAIMIFNELDIDYSWPETHSDEEYGRVLGEYAQEMKDLVGDIPIIVKTTAWQYDDDLPNVFPIIEGAADSSTAGLGIDAYPHMLSSPMVDTVATYSSELSLREEQTSLLWMSEFGVGNANPGGDCESDSWPYASKDEMRSHMLKYVENGARGLIFFGGYNPCAGDFTSSYQWFMELKDEISATIREHL